MRSRLFSLQFRIIFYCINSSRVLSPSSTAYIDSFVSDSAFDLNGIRSGAYTSIGREKNHLYFATRRTLDSIATSSTPFSATATQSIIFHCFVIIADCAFFEFCFFFIVLVLPQSRSRHH